MINIIVHEWVTIDAFGIRKDYYEVSRYGEVRVKKSGKILKQMLSRTKTGAYLRVPLTMECGGIKKFLVHRLVAYHFCGKPKHPKRLVVNHIDGRKTYNVWYNLEWCTPSENMIHAYKYGLATTRGEQCHFCKFSDDTVHAICKLMEAGYKPKEIMRELNLLDIDKYPYTSPEYNKVRGYIKKLRTQTFRKDITLQYKL